MTRAEQIRFIRELSKSVADRLCDQAAKFPEEWDGHELRVLLADAHEQSARMTMAHKNGPSRRRRRAYLNECAVRNIG